MSVYVASTTRMLSCTSLVYCIHKRDKSHTDC